MTRELEEQVLGIVRALATELYPQRGATAATLDSSLDRDLGFDSLARGELLLRISEATGVELPESLLSHAERPRDLLAPIEAGPRAAKLPLVAARAPSPPSQSIQEPATATTLTAVLEAHAIAHPARVHVDLYEGASDAPRSIAYAALLGGARRTAAGLRRAGLGPGEAVAIMLPTSATYLETFLGVLLAGGVAVPIYPPARPSQLEEHLERHGRILDNAQAKVLVAPSAAHGIVRLLRHQTLSLETVASPEELTAAEESIAAAPVEPDDIAMLQYTSGSTGHPKGVILTHRQLLANIRAMGNAIRARSDDVFLSWLPLYHDMGLIGAWLGSLYFGMRLVLMPPTAFLGRPSRWLTRMHEHRATISGAPNFAYETCVARIRDEQIAGIDLSAWRLAFSGAEPVNPATLRRFAARFAPFGFRAEALLPAYGLAEAGVGLTLPPLERGPRFDRVDRDGYQLRDEAEPARGDNRDALEFVSCGQALPGYQLRIVDDAGIELPDRREGRIEFRGPSATRGYMRNPEATAQLLDGAWLDTGDLGYVADGELFVTSRVKDLIKRAGRNIYPYEVEAAVGDLPGVRSGCVAAFGTSGPSARTERLVVVAETADESADRDALRARIDRTVADVLGFAADDVVLVPPQGVPKTASGKIRRPTCRERYELGELGRPAAGVALQVVRLWWIGARHWRRRLADAAFAWWARIAFGVIGGCVWSAVALLPSRGAAWAVARAGAKLLLWSTGIAVTVHGLERLPTRPCVFVCNHSSYLDGIALMAALPRIFAFVVKGELEQQFATRLFLRRIGASFVERFDAQKGIEDARRVATRLETGESVLFFPEGTFTRMPGLLPFHMGAFVAAAESGVPAVPIALVGTRSILRDDDAWYPHRGAATVHIAPAIRASGTDWPAAIALRAQVRKSILERVGGPDLAQLVGIRPGAEPE